MAGLCCMLAWLHLSRCVVVGHNGMPISLDYFAAQTMIAFIACSALITNLNLFHKQDCVFVYIISSRHLVDYGCLKIASLSVLTIGSRCRFKNVSISAVGVGHGGLSLRVRCISVVLWCFLCL